MYRSLVDVEQEVRNTAVTADDLKRCRLCGTYCIAHYWQCDWDDDSSEPDFIADSSDALLIQLQEQTVRY